MEQYAILLVCVSLGCSSPSPEANKLFVAGGTKPVYETLVKAKVPFPHLMEPVSEVLRNGPYHDFIDVYIGRLFDGVGDRTSDGFR